LVLKFQATAEKTAKNLTGNYLSHLVEDRYFPHSANDYSF